MTGGSFAGGIAAPHLEQHNTWRDRADSDWTTKLSRWFWTQIGSLLCTAVSESKHEVDRSSSPFGFVSGESGLAHRQAGGDYGRWGGGCFLFYHEEVMPRIWDRRECVDNRHKCRAAVGASVRRVNVSFTTVYWLLIRMVDWMLRPTVLVRETTCLYVSLKNLHSSQRQQKDDDVCFLCCIPSWEETGLVL